VFPKRWPGICGDAKRSMRLVVSFWANSLDTYSVKPQ
jgi:hypothetical protein